MRFNLKNMKSIIIFVAVIAAIVFTARLSGVGTYHSGVRIGYIEYNSSQSSWAAR